MHASDVRRLVSAIAGNPDDVEQVVRAFCSAHLEDEPAVAAESAAPPAQEAVIVHLLSAIPQLLAIPEEVEELLDGWADGVQPFPTSHVADWRERASALLELVAALVASLKSGPAVLLDPRWTNGDEGGTAGSLESTSFHQAPRRDRPSMRAEEEAAWNKCAVVRAGAPLSVRLLVCVAQAATALDGEDDVESASAQASGAGSIQSPRSCGSGTLGALAQTTEDALALASGEPLIRLRVMAMGDFCRLLNVELELAQAAKRTVRTRTLAGALAHGVVSLRRPHLSRSSEAHKLLPLLLRWSEILDACARARVLRAVRHAVTHLASPEVRWHGALLAHVLRKMIVFREPAALAQLLPALFDAWPHVASEHATRSGAEREALDIGLLDTLANELLYVAAHVPSRRLYLRHLPALMPHMGVRLACKLPALISGVTMLLDAELDEADKAQPRGTATNGGGIRGSGGLEAARASRHRLAESRGAVCSALALLESLLREVWPRVPGHAPEVVKHAVAAYIRTAVAGCDAAQPETADTAETLAPAPEPARGPTETAHREDILQSACSLLRFICQAGSEQVCAAALEAIRVRAPAGSEVQVALAALAAALPLVCE